MRHVLQLLHLAAATLLQCEMCNVCNDVLKPICDPHHCLGKYAKVQRGRQEDAHPWSTFSFASQDVDKRQHCLGTNFS